jgi:hypothetical protein
MRQAKDKAEGSASFCEQKEAKKLLNLRHGAWRRQRLSAG